MEGKDEGKDIEDKEGEDEVEFSLKELIIAGALFIIAIVIQQVGYLSSIYIAGIPVSKAAILIYLLSYLAVGLNVVKGAIYHIVHGKVFDEQLLMAIASLGAVAIGEYPEAVAVMLFYGIGEYFQDYAVGKSRRSIEALVASRPKKATVVRQNLEVDVAPEDIAVGETLVLKAGQKLALDGVVVGGKGYMNTSALTGESVPRMVDIGSLVYAGFIDTDSLLYVKVLKPYKDSSIARILELVENSEQKKSHSERFISKFAHYYTPIVTIAALLMAIVPPIVIGGAWAQYIRRALIFLVVSCPCALVISIPLGFMGGIGRASRYGILIKGAGFIEALARTKIAVFDKTGTITCGNFTVAKLYPYDSDNAMGTSDAANAKGERLLALACHAESSSKHPIALSLREAHHCRQCGRLNLSSREVSGQGIIATIGKDSVLVGNHALMAEQKVVGYTPYTGSANGTIVHVALEHVYQGCILIQDTIKEASRKAIEELKKLGVSRIVMLTGDREGEAMSVAKACLVDEVHSQLMPEGKLECLEELIKEGGKLGGKVLYAGDGINDAPVIARADIGVAMGAMGQDAAIEAADVVVMSDDLSRIAASIKIARHTMAIVKENIAFALAFKFAIMLTGALGLTGIWFAVFADVGVAILAVLNSMRQLLGGKIR